MRKDERESIDDVFFYVKQYVKWAIICSYLPEVQNVIFRLD